MKEYEEDLKGKILPDTHLQTIRVRSIAKKITEALQREMVTSHSDGKRWEILAVNDSQLYAGSCIGGTILLSTGLLDQFKRDEEIATIIDHEVGHDVARHTAEIFTNPMLVLTHLRDTLYEIFESYDSYYFPRLAIFCFNHLQRMEIEADYIGILLLALVGYDSRVAPGVYTKIHKLNGQDPNRKYCFSTHPSYKERVEKLTKYHVIEEALSKYWDMQAGYIMKEEYLCNHYALLYIDEDKHV